MVLQSRDQPKGPAAALQQKADMPAAAPEGALCRGTEWEYTYLTPQSI